MNKKLIIKECIKDIKGDYFEQEEDLISEGWLSSFELIALIEQLERRFGTSFPIEELSKEMFDSVSNINEMVNRYTTAMEG